MYGYDYIKLHTPGEIFQPDEIPFFTANCPVCSSPLTEYRHRADKERHILRVCSSRPARKDVLTSHQSKAHYYDTTFVIAYATVSRLVFSHRIRVKQEETHPDKFLLKVDYQYEKKTAESPKENSSTSVTAKNNWQTVQIKNLWNPGQLTTNNHAEVYHRASRLIHLT